MNDRLAWWEEIPLGLALIAQSYVVGLWYYASIAGASAWVDLAVAVGAGLALDLIVVTTVMGRRAGRSSGWSWATSLGAFVCSSLIALDRYGWEWRSGLHIAFPLVVFLYSQHLATPRKRSVSAQAETAQHTATPATTGQAFLDELLATSLEAPSEPLDLEQPVAPAPVSGYVYALLSEGNGVKIGCATDVTKRFGSIAGFLPFEIELFHTIATDDMYAMERSIHRYYEMAGKRINGEWFRLDAYDLQALKQVSASDAATIFEDASRVLAPMVLRGIKLLDNVDSSLILKESAKQYRCPHCERPLKNKQAVGAARTNGYCRECKVERLAA